MPTILEAENSPSNIDWVDVLFFTLTPIGCLVLIPLYFHFFKWSWPLFAFFLVFSSMTSLSITGGYHRLFSHCSYEVKPWVRFLYVLGGAAAFQGPAIKWSTDHRRHHRYVDTNQDPYNINRGFWYAHIGWLFIKQDAALVNKFEPDLEKDRWMVWQNRYYVPVAIGTAFVFPTIVGWMLTGFTLQGAFGGLVFAGLLRVVLTNHCTFFINSLCHFIGSRPYSEKNSARDSFVMAILAFGEGYHNFHHQFASDYRNGIRWYHWDPTKWFIRFLASVGLASRLKDVSETEILRAKLSVQHRHLVNKGLPEDQLHALKTKVEEAQKRFRSLVEEYRVLKRDWTMQSQIHLAQLRVELKAARLDFKRAFAQWRRSFKTLQIAPAPNPVPVSVRV